VTSRLGRLQNASISAEAVITKSSLVSTESPYATYSAGSRYPTAFLLFLKSNRDRHIYADPLLWLVDLRGGQVFPALSADV
jgi:hypothetical protein